MNRVPAPSLRLVACLALLGAVGGALAQEQLGYQSSGEAARALRVAQAAGEAARHRAELLEASAAAAAAEADRTAEQGAALAARIQQAEAAIAADEARATLIAHQREALRVSLAQRQRPLIELTAALQRLARRPPLLSLLRPGSLREAVYLRASLEALLPQVAARTAGLRAEIARGEALEQQAGAAAAALRAGETDLTRRRQALAALETRQRLASRSASGIADRESDRALALAEQARDLSALVDQLGQAGELRSQLATLPGPVLRPAQPGAALPPDPPPPPPAADSAPAPYQLPVNGDLVAGFGDATPGKVRTRGIALASPAGAQVVAPGAGRIVFAGPYQGYGSIVIVEHPGQWVSLVTGLGDLEARVGDAVVAGSPLGRAGPGRPVLTLELRHGGEPVNPLTFLRQ